MLIDRCRHRQQLLKMPWVTGVIAEIGTMGHILGQLIEIV